MNNKERIIYLPGLSADKRLFSEMKKYLPGEDIVWPDFNTNDSLSSFAKKCNELNSIKPEDILIGFSFGAMVAKEMRKEVKYAKSGVGLVMLSGCRNRNAVDSKFKRNAKFIQYLPNFILRILSIYIGPQFTARSRGEKEYSKLLKQMAKDSDLHFLKNSAIACVNWKDMSDVPMLQIHGEKDSVIPYPNQDPDYIIDGANHLICYTHAQEVSNLISKIL